jgi:putative transposase
VAERPVAPYHDAGEQRSARSFQKRRGGKQNAIEAFLLYIEKVLVPTLRQGDIVIMDNLGSHKANAVRRAIRAVGARLFYLPKYSPDLNPIEQFFAKLKHWLRKAEKRTTDAVFNALGPILDTLSSAECANYFANAGYDQT